MSYTVIIESGVGGSMSNTAPYKGAGTYTLPVGSVISIKALPNVDYVWVNWAYKVNGVEAQYPNPPATNPDTFNSNSINRTFTIGPVFERTQVSGDTLAETYKGIPIFLLQSGGYRFYYPDALTGTAHYYNTLGLCRDKIDELTAPTPPPPTANDIQIEIRPNGIVIMYNPQYWETHYPDLGIMGASYFFNPPNSNSEQSASTLDMIRIMADSFTVTPPPPPPVTPNGCFILTALGDDALVYEARAWRDERIHWFKPVYRFYYMWSPAIAYLIRHSDKFKRIVEQPIRKLAAFIMRFTP